MCRDLFEGHSSATDAALVRGDLCEEALWLAGLVHELVPDDPEVSGLLALILFSDARRAARSAADGSVVLLADQDRSQWDRAKIGQGLALLATAHSAGQRGPYQFQAAIAALHTTAESFEQTDWPLIIGLYDVLVGDGRNAVAEVGNVDQARLFYVQAIERTKNTAKRLPLEGRLNSIADNRSSGK